MPSSCLRLTRAVPSPPYLRRPPLRPFLFPALILLIGCPTQVTHAQPNWPATSFRRAVIGADPHNANRMFEQFAEVADCGADMVVFTGHLRGEAWYPSELAKYSPTLVVDDAVAEGARRGHELGMRAVVYVGAPLIQQALRDKTDWRQRGAQGEDEGSRRLVGAARASGLASRLPQETRHTDHHDWRQHPALAGGAARREGLRGLDGEAWLRPAHAPAVHPCPGPGVAGPH